MPTVEQIQQQLEDVETLQHLSSALLEIASIKIKGLREEFQTNQEFFEEVSDLYRLVKSAAQKQNYQIVDTRDSKKDVHVAVTSNKRFHGILNRTVMDSFVEVIDDGDTDYIVIGFTGKHIVEGTEYGPRCQYMSFNNDYPTPKELEVFLKRIDQYGKVYLHFPKFVNIFRQEAEVTDITYSSEFDQEADAIEGEIEQIYEPELPHIVNFFESQVRQLLFTRIMLESELSRTAARLVKMNTTEDSAESVILEKKQILRKEMMVNEDIRLLETFSSRVQWEKS